MTVCPYCKRSLDDHPALSVHSEPNQTQTRYRCPYVSELGAMRIQNEELYLGMLRRRT